MFTHAPKRSIGWRSTLPACLWLVLLTTTVGHARPTNPTRTSTPDHYADDLAITGIGFTPLSATSVRLSWGNPLVAFDDILVVGKLGASLTGKPTSATYTAAASFTSTSSGTVDGGKVLYQGRNESVVITDLTAGQLYYLRVFTRKGTVWNEGVELPVRVANRAPVILFTATSLSGTSPLSVSFNTSKTYDPDGDALIYYEWRDANTFKTLSNEANPVLTFYPQQTRGGNLITSYEVELLVRDAGGGVSFSGRIRIQLTNVGPDVTIESPSKISSYRLMEAQVYPLSAKVFTVGNPITTWQATLHYNNREFPQPPITVNGSLNGSVRSQTTFEPVGCNGENYYYLITLKVTDGQGLTFTDTSRAYPISDCSIVNVNISGLTATTLANGSVKLNWNKGIVVRNNSHDVLVVGRAGGSFTDRPASASYITSTSFTGNGAAYDGGKALYQGLDSSLVVTNLTPGQRYFFRVYTRVPNAITDKAWSGGIETSITIPAATTTSPTAVTAVEPGKCYRLVSRLSGKVLGVEGNATNDGASIRQRTDGNLLSQGWRFTPDGAYYNISALHTLKGIQVVNASTAENALLEQWTYWGGNHQQWTVRRTNEGYFTFINRNSNKAMTVLNANTADGAEVGQQIPGAGQQQQWRIEERTCNATAPTNRAPVAVATATSLSGTSPLSVTFTGSKSYDPDGDPITYEWDFGDETSYVTEANPVKVFVAKPAKLGIGLILNYTVRLTVIDNKGLRSPVQTFYVALQNPAPVASIDPAKCYRIQSRSSGLVLTVPAGASADGVGLQQRANADQAWQKWRFTPDGTYYRMSVLHTLKGIQVVNASTAENALLEQWTYWGGGHQQWTAQRNNEGYYTFSNRNANKVISVLNASTAEGAAIVQQTLGTGNQQQWSLVETTCPAGGRMATEARMAAAEPSRSFSLYPTPASNQVLIDLSASEGLPVQLTLHNMLGRTLRQTEIEAAPATPYSYSTDQLPEGLYLMQITPARQVPTTLRLLIQR
ncbi:RICIN domain-containing protein [Fibrella aquatilis]|uniref:RICIN domain-containing protein n=1 Tax=Fibrella aquatilis TaxID=2817059 RepID=A0A939G696_9BACT|nr:RICIN domain-containing protein [Fibrella aquatilis]MBO0931379.1 RICIN domain-containing protein [Fibrella aquatilis]